MKNVLHTFKSFPKDSICPICKGSEDKECFLVPILETQKGNLAEAIIIHTGCLDLVYSRRDNIVYQILK